jgi:hypothetical protein
MYDYETFIALVPFLVYVAALTVGVGVTHCMLVKKTREEAEDQVQRLKETVGNLKRS